jgi:hypothetical protein
MDARTVMSTVPLQNGVGMVRYHDITNIIPGQKKTDF